MAAESLQETEVSGLKSSFDGHVNDIKGIGDFTHVLSLRPTLIDIVCKFQLSASYPFDPPSISVRSSVLSPDEMLDLAEFLQTASKTFVGQPMIQELMQKGLDWCKDNEISGDTNTIEQKDKKKGKQRKRAKGNKEKVEETLVAKKPPMKTAADVIKRLQWDPDVPKEDFIVGYMDRLVGLQERPFTAFTWEDLASVDHFALAIPQHRIQYFKYKTVKVWDKNERLDDVFGSTGSKINVLDAMARYDNSVAQQEGAVGGANLAEINVIGEECSHFDEMLGDCVDKAEYEEAEMSNKTGGAGFDEETNKVNNVAEDNADNTELQATVPIKKGKNSNYFLGLQIQDEKLVKQLVDVQRQIIEMYPFYKDYIINKNGFHLTLRLLNLKCVDDVRTAATTMKQISHQVKDYMQKIKPLYFQGLDHFGPKVVYVKVKYTAAFLDLIEYIATQLLDAGVHVLSQHLVPHLTLFKIPKSVKQKGRPEPPILLRFNDLELGTQLIDNVHLCQMGTLTENSEFYTTAASIMLQE